MLQSLVAVFERLDELRLDLRELDVLDQLVDVVELLLGFVDERLLVLLLAQQ